MKVLLIQIDGPMKNLALRKLGGYFRARGDQVYYNNGCSNPDKVFISCIFEKNAPKARGIAKMFSCPVEIGGYGISDVKLPDEIEHHMPDYEGMDYSFGFSTRGCIRNCPWCIVPKMEGYIRDHAPISEFHHPDHNKLILWDNNLLALRWKFKEDAKYINENGLKVCFNQGLDIRLVDEEIAGLLADCDYKSLSFKERRIYISFDTPQIEPQLRVGLQHLVNAGVGNGEVMGYMLCGDPWNYPNGYDFAVDYHRFKVLIELGVDPYVMKYNSRRDIRILNHFSRWVIKRDYKRKTPKYLRPNEWQELQDAINLTEKKRGGKSG